MATISKMFIPSPYHNAWINAQLSIHMPTTVPNVLEYLGYQDVTEMEDLQLAVHVISNQ